MNIQKQAFFRKTLLQWHQENPRSLPWKESSDPYLIWLSEIILQQTRVEQGTPYFLAFQKKFPTVHHLANASEDEVLKLWEGLGYYSRARNLHYSAKYISKELSGRFPDNYEGILKLKGVGPYTAAAIASFAYNQPHAVLDGNVFRVLSRIFGIHDAIDTTEGKKKFTQLAQDLLHKENPSAYNQAIMDFGATQCTPKTPDCESCPFRSACFARENEQVATLPLKAKKLKKNHRYFNYLVFLDGKQTLLQRRDEKDIWQGLYQYPLLETRQANTSLTEIKNYLKSKFGLDQLHFHSINVSETFRQTLSHRYIHARFWQIDIKELPKEKTNHLIAVRMDQISTFAFPKVIQHFHKDNKGTLELGF